MQFDAIVSDVSMPGLDGVGLLRAVRERDLDVAATDDDDTLFHFISKRPRLPIESLFDLALSRRSWIGTMLRWV